MFVDNDINGYYFDELSIGMTASFAKTITNADILAFAGVSGDTNPLHINDEYAKNTIFKGRIAHGMIAGGLISAVLGTKLPGPGCIYVNQMLKFKAPVRVGDTVVAKVELKELVEKKNFVVFKTTCHVGTTIVVDGEATLMVPTRDV